MNVIFCKCQFAYPFDIDEENYRQWYKGNQILTSKMPKFSIIVANYNSGVAEMIDSFRTLNLSNEGFEFIIIDNDSKDGGLLRVNWSKLNKKIVMNKQNCGFSKADNQGIKLSTGKYIILRHLDKGTTSPNAWHWGIRVRA